jgi:Domain of unknown function (DUF4345)
MRTYSMMLRLLAPVFFVVAALHVALGLGADALLGAQLPPAVLVEPSLDSQNRFYGMAFSVYGVVLQFAASDPLRYVALLRQTLAVFFLSGIARLVSWALYGAPAPLVIALGAVEVIGPPLMIGWLHALCRQGERRDSI